jgi:hypothetical protein
MVTTRMITYRDFTFTFGDDRGNGDRVKWLEIRTELTAPMPRTLDVFAPVAAGHCMAGKGGPPLRLSHSKRVTIDVVS